MAFDGRYEDVDGPGEARPEQGPRRDETGGDGPGESAEPRSRGEYYQALKAADDDESRDGQGDGQRHSADAENGRANDSDRSASDDQEGATDTPDGESGWGAVEAEKRPPLDAIGVSAERATHILDGDPGGGGGHRHGIGRLGKTEFPATWSDEKILSHAIDVSRRPDSPPVLQNRNDRWVCTGTRDNVEISVILLRSGEVWTAWPEEGSPGVVRNPRKGVS